MTNLNTHDRFPQASSNVVYYIGVKDDDHVKIGTTKNLTSRLRALSTARADGDRLVVLATEPGTYELEQRRHEEFAGSRVHGEWFKMTPALQEHIDRLALRVNSAYVIGYDDGYQTALNDRNVVALVSCESCGDERGIPSGHVDDDEHDSICAHCEMETQMGIELTSVCERLIRAYGYDQALEVATVLPGTLYSRVVQRMKERQFDPNSSIYDQV